MRKLPGQCLCHSRMCTPCRGFPCLNNVNNICTVSLNLHSIYLTIKFLFTVLYYVYCQYCKTTLSKQKYYLFFVLRRWLWILAHCPKAQGSEFDYGTSLRMPKKGQHSPRELQGRGNKTDFSQNWLSRVLNILNYYDYVDLYGRSPSQSPWGGRRGCRQALFYGGGGKGVKMDSHIV